MSLPQWQCPNMEGKNAGVELQRSHNPTANLFKYYKRISHDRLQSLPGKDLPTVYTAIPGQFTYSQSRYGHSKNATHSARWLYAAYNITQSPRFDPSSN